MLKFLLSPVGFSYLLYFFVSLMVHFCLFFKKYIIGFLGVVIIVYMTPGFLFQVLTQLISCFPINLSICRIINLFSFDCVCSLLFETQVSDQKDQ